MTHIVDSMSNFTMFCKNLCTGNKLCKTDPELSLHGHTSQDLVGPDQLMPVVSLPRMQYFTLDILLK